MELKNGKLVFKQKSLSFEKMSETMQGTCPSHEPSPSTIRTCRATEIVKFREMLEERLAAKESPLDRKSTRLNSSHSGESRMPSSA